MSAGIHGIDDIIAEQHCEGFIADDPLGGQHGVAETKRLFLPDIAERHQIGDPLYFGKQFVLALCLEVLLEFEGHIKMVFNGPLAPAR